MSIVLEIGIMGGLFVAALFLLNRGPSDKEFGLRKPDCKGK
ncbi:hypothetical protein [Geomesophilobacter sediminis]|nr:hypothetical protein [Geomesophilobacter sediminis]